MDAVKKELVLEVLKADTEKIYSLIDSQKEHLCFATCPAFEEVVDTQLFGLSKQIEFAINLGLLDKEDGFRILSDLETSLNSMYTHYYENQRNKPATNEEAE